MQADPAGGARGYKTQGCAQKWGQNSELPLFQTTDNSISTKAVVRRCDTLQETTLTWEHVVGCVPTAGKNHPARKSNLGLRS